jgi:hypothetical protein
MDWLMIALLGLFILFEGFVVGRALFTGRRGFREHVTHRDDDPTQFWAMTCLSALTIPASAWLIWRYARGDPPAPGSTDGFDLILTATVAFWLIRFLVSGVAGVSDTRFSRSEEPREYWLLTAFVALALAFLLWRAAGGSFLG